MSRRVAFIGLGVMGYPMAGHLVAAGHEVTVFNRTKATADRWVAGHGGRAAGSPAEAARDASLVFSCVGNDDDVRAVLTGPDGALSGVSAGAVLVDHTTASAELAAELAGRAASVDAGFVDAPVSGGQAGAENGALTVMAGGDPAHYGVAEPVIAAYAHRCRLLGPAGSGQRAKMVNQICIAGLLQGLAEALAFSERAGLDTAAVVDVIAGGAAQSWQMDNRAATMLEDRYDFGFAVDWMRKDLGLALAEAGRNGASLPATALVDQFYARVQEMGGGRWDTSSLMRLLGRSK